MQKEEYFIKNACYSVTKSYLCKQNNKRSLLGRKQRSQVARSFLNRYQFSCINNVTYLFSIRYTLINIFESKEIVNVRFLKKYTNFSNSLKLHFHSIKEYKDAASDHTYICN